MKTNKTSSADQEPIGIVISRGSRHEHVPVVFAYVWGPAPETGAEAADGKAG
jgi:hypothetical protein